MADVSAEAGLSVQVQGEDNIQRLAAALQNLQQAGARVQQTVTAAGSSAETRATAAGIKPIIDNANQQVSTLGQKIASVFNRQINNALRAPVEVLRASGQVAGRSLLALSGSLGEVATTAGGTATAVVAFGIAVTGLAVPLFNIIAGFKLLRSTFDWASQAAEEQIRIAGRTRRFFPQLMGDALIGAEESMRVNMATTTALFGEGADQMQESISRRLSEYRLGRGIRGDQDIFRRWGITPETMRTFESATGKIDLAKWTRLFIIQREELETQMRQRERMGEAPNSPARMALARRMADLGDFAVRVFGQKFADMVNSISERDFLRLQKNMQRAVRLGRARDPRIETRNMVDFTISLESLKATFAALKDGIGADVTPSITSFLTELNRKMLDTEEGGQGLGRSLRDLASTMADSAWRALSDIMERIKPETINSWITELQRWSPEETAETVASIIGGVVRFGAAVIGLIGTIQRFVEAMPDWLVGRKPKQLRDLAEEAGIGHISGAAAEGAPAATTPGGAGAEAPGAGYEPTAPHVGGPEAPAAGPAEAPEAPAARGGGIAETLGTAARAAGSTVVEAARTAANPIGTGAQAIGRVLGFGGQAQAAPGAPSAETAPTATAAAGAVSSAAATPPATMPAMGAPSAIDQGPAAAGPATAGAVSPMALPISPEGPQAAMGPIDITAPTLPQATTPQMPSAAELRLTGPSAGPPPPMPTGPVTGALMPQQEALPPAWSDDWVSGLGAGAVPEPVATAAATAAAETTRADAVQASAALDTVRGSAQGSMLAGMANVEQGPGGQPLLHLASFGQQGDADQALGRNAVRWGLWGAGQAAELTGLGPPGSSQIGSAFGQTATMNAPPADFGHTAGAVIRGAVPGMGLFTMMHRDAEEGHPVRSYLRNMLGIDDPHEPAPWQREETAPDAALELTRPNTFDERWSGLGAMDGAAFGAAAAMSMREGLEGASVTGGYAPTSYGVAPRSAPKPTGGDTPSEA